MNKFNILFLGGAKRVSLARSFIESGLKRGVAVKIFSYEIIQDTPISFIGEVISGKKWNDKNILEDLEDVIFEKKIDLLLPCVDSAISIASKLKTITKSSCFFPVSDLKYCEIFFNKQLTYDWCIENSINVPSSAIKFPMIAKPNHGSASQGILIIDNQNDFESFSSNYSLSNYNLQQFIYGTEYSVDLYISPQSKKVISVVPRIRLDVLGGEAVKSMTIWDEALIDLSMIVAKKSGLIGPLVIQFIRDNNTKIDYLMEINPRFGGAVMCSIGAGADFPGYLIDEALGEVVVEKEKWESDILMVRTFTEYFKKKQF
jgi:carbamoyl-phosphate synthase large subunit